MAVVNLCGWETGNTNEAASVGGTYSVQNSIARNSGYALRTNTSTTGYHRFRGLAATGDSAAFSLSTVYARVYVYIATLPSAGEYQLLGVQTSSAAMGAAVFITSDGKLYVHDATFVTYSPGATVLSLNTWYRIEIKVVRGNGTGTCDVLLDGVSELALTGLNTDQGVNFGQVCVGQDPAFLTSFSGTPDVYFDDLVISSSAYPGAGQCGISVPTGDSATYNNGTANGAASKYLCIDDRPHDSDTTYVNALGNGNANTSTLGASGVGSGTVLCAKALLLARRNGGTNGSIKLRTRSGSTNTDTTARAATSSYAAWAKLFETDPNTAAAWTSSALDAAEVGMVESSANASRYTAAYLMYDYVPGAASVGMTYARKCRRVGNLLRM